MRRWRAFGVLAASVVLAGMDYRVPGYADPSGAKTVEQTCRDYADAAVRQVGEARRRGCIPSGSRWDSNRDVHYNWCMRIMSADAKNAGAVNNENAERQNFLATACRDRACETYAQTAVRQQADNRKYNCGLGGPAWNDKLDYHYKWCIHGGNRQNIERENSARNRALAFCRPDTTLDGTFTVRSVIPVVEGEPKNRYLQSVDIMLEADSATPWTIGDYGHPQYGSLWAEVTVNTWVYFDKTGRAEKRSKTHLVSIRGTAAGGLGFRYPPSGQRVNRGRQTVRLATEPLPRAPLTGIEVMFGTPGGLFGSGGTGCLYNDPDVSVKVFVVNKNKLATVRTGKSKPIMNATYFRVFNSSKGNLSNPCRAVNQ